MIRFVGQLLLYLVLFIGASFAMVPIMCKILPVEACTTF